MKVASTHNVRLYELTEFEWYGDNPDTAGERQANMIESVIKDAYDFDCLYAVVYVTPDDIFSVSPIHGRHKVFSESLSPIIGTYNVEVTAKVDLDKYLSASEHRKEIMLHVAEKELRTFALNIPNTVRSEYRIIGVHKNEPGTELLRSFKC